MVTVSVAVGDVTWYLMTTRAGLIASAQVHAAQAVRLQSVASELAQADAEATTGFLAGGLESPAQRARYDASIDGVTTTLAAAAAARPADAQALGAVNRAVAQYVERVTSARTFNRLDLPVGAAFMLQATNQNRDTTLPQLAGLVTREVTAAQDDLDRAARLLWVILAAVLAGVVALLAAQMWLARRTRRVLHPSMAVGTGLLTLVLLTAVWATAGSASSAAGVGSGAFAATRELAQLRVAVFQARSAESMTLIQRGTGQPFEVAFSASVADARRRAEAAGPTGGDGVRLLDRWTSRHAAIRALDDAGKWEEAVAGATDPRAPLAVAFDEVAEWSAGRLADRAHATAAGLAAAQPPGGLAWAALLVGLVSASGAAGSLLTRLEEYR